jgi:hypothetical protein
VQPATVAPTQAVAPQAKPDAVKPEATPKTPPAPAAQPSAPSVQSAPSATTGRLHRVGSVSIKATQASAPVAAPQSHGPQNQPLDEKGLQQCWDAMLNAMKEELPKLSEQLKDKKLNIEQEDFFTIEVNNSYLESEIKPHLIRMLTYMRNRSGRPNLNCKIVVVYEEKEAVVYTPRDKYDVMQKSNPALDTFRVLFPEVDY